ncbi:hypothetical protein PLICRDRAFT_452766 [Plicaturopsis crispa FD-325 SS-3]|uniref:Unplaced genomic scaffold PLICRscaffold_26, whole genome shotgun sequence n=1 Tax=Plicaturopsis crispa FD-325 SS-3 TaxID=944288 RepID=A0A0C9SK75_PLICR|nr:hypothetical protein PLICRDRAFT_452766 [Plicaturopsis crispa FD-325 SS-3]
MARRLARACETTTTERDAGWRLVSSLRTLPPPPFLPRSCAHAPRQPPPANDHAPAISRAVGPRTPHDDRTRRQRASRRRRRFQKAALHDPMPAVSRALCAHARETTTTKRDASRRLVLIASPTAFPAAVLPARTRPNRQPQHTTTGAPSRTRREPAHARRRRRNETPAGVSSSSRHSTRRRRRLPSRRAGARIPPHDHPQRTTTGPPSRARCEHARRKRRNETPAGVSSSLFPEGRPQCAITGPPSRALCTHAHGTTTPPPYAHVHGRTISRTRSRRRRRNETPTGVSSPSFPAAALSRDFTQTAPLRAQPRAVSRTLCTRPRETTTERDASRCLVSVDFHVPNHLPSFFLDFFSRIRDLGSRARSARSIFFFW